MIKIHGHDVPTSIDELIQQLRPALLIVDMQNDFCADGGSAARWGADVAPYRAITSRIGLLAQHCRDAGVPVVHIRMLTLPDGASDSPSWLRLRMRTVGNAHGGETSVFTFAVQGTWGAEFVTGLEPQPGDLIVDKFRSSAFHKTDLDRLLRANRVETVLVCGCTTEGCVESTVRDAGFFDYFPVVVADCVASDVRELHEASLLVMSAYRADVAESADVIRIIQGKDDEQ